MSSNANIDPKAIEALPLAVRKTIPAQAPPPGITPNFDNPDSHVAEIIGVSCAFCAIALVCYSIRVYTKILIAKRWSWDDITITLGFMFGITVLGFVINGCIHSATGKHLWDVHIDQVMNSAALLQAYTTIVLVQPGLGLVKVSLFIQYYAIFGRLRWMRIAVWTGGIFHVVFYSMATIVAFALCSPWNGETWFETITSWHYLILADLSTPLAAVSMAIDWYLLILPIPAVMKLQLSTTKKLGLLAVFSTGGLATVASVVNLIYRARLQMDPSDVTWKVGYVLMMNQIEIFAGVAVSSMPSVRHFSTHKELSISAWARSLSSKISRTTSRSLDSQEKKSPASRRHRHSSPEWYTGRAASARSSATLEARDSQIKVTKDFSVVREV